MAKEKSLLEKYGGILLSYKGKTGDDNLLELVENSFSLAMLLEQGLYSNSLCASYLIERIISEIPDEKEKEFSSLKDFFEVFKFAFDESLALPLKLIDNSYFYPLFDEIVLTLKQGIMDVESNGDLYEETLNSNKTQESLKSYELFRASYVHLYHLIELQRSLEDSRAYQQIIGDCFNAYLVYLADKAFDIHDEFFLRPILIETKARLNFYESLISSKRNKIKVLKDRENIKNSLLVKSKLLPRGVFPRSVQNNNYSLDDLKLNQYVKEDGNESIQDSLVSILNKVFDSVIKEIPESKRDQLTKEKNYLARRIEKEKD